MEEPVEIPWYLNGVYILVGAILIGLAITCIVFLFKKVIHGWFGVFALLVSVYTLFLILKIYLGIEAEPEEEKAIGSIWAYIAIILPDLFIIFYSLSTLMGSQAELLSQKFKRFGLDTVIIWLFLSKVTYEFIHYFPYDLFSNANTPWIQWLSNINNDLINLLKNIAVLAFFILLLIIIGIYEIRKYSLEQKELKEEVEAEVKELLAPQPTFEEPPPVGEKSEIMEVLETDILEDEGDHDETMEDVDTDIFKDEGDRDETMEDVDSDIFKDDSSHEEITEDVDTDTFNDEDIHKNNNEME